MKAFTVMLDVSADRKYHSVITGKVAGGKAKLTLSKTFKTELSPGNPTGKKFIKEHQVMKLTTDKDGSFEWHLGPSSRPYEKRVESYQLSILQGKRLSVMKVSVARGERLNLGRISLKGSYEVVGDVVVLGEPPERR